LRSTRAARGEARCRSSCRSPAQKAAPRKLRDCRLRWKYRPRDVSVSENLSIALRVLLFGHLAQPRHSGTGPIPVKRVEKADLARKEWTVKQLLTSSRALLGRTAEGGCPY